MNHDTFRKKFDRIGFDVTTDWAPSEQEKEDMDDPRPVLVATNSNGDDVYWNRDTDTNEWSLYFDPSGASLDTKSLAGSEVAFTDDAVVIEGASGTRSSTTGYGRSTWEGTFRLDADGVTITEEHTYSA